MWSIYEEQISTVVKYKLLQVENMDFDIETVKKKKKEFLSYFLQLEKYVDKYSHFTTVSIPKKFYKIIKNDDVDLNIKTYFCKNWNSLSS